MGKANKSLINIYLVLFVIAFLFSCGENDITPIETLKPKFTMDPLSVAEGDETKSIFLNLRLTESSENTVNVTLRTVDNGAIAGEDYQEIQSQKVEFSPGMVQTGLKLEIFGDEQFELDESFIVRVTQIEGAELARTEVEVVIENDDEGSLSGIPESGYSTPTSYPGMEMIWSDEFEGDYLNENFWTYEIGNGHSGWGNNELQFYRRENTSLKDGHLIIQARKENYGGFNYTSSRIITENKFEFKYGRVDIRAVIPEGKGVWPALWTLGENIRTVGWPRCGEMDIMELVGHRPSTVHATVHYSNTNGDRIMNGSEISLPGGKKFSQEFHVFSMIWEEDKVDFYMDDIKYHSITRASLGTDNPYPFNKPFFFIFNVAVGGNWPGSPNSTTVFPQNMIVDYIRVFQEEK